jgi:hydrogenase nickel incorporation protein HypA/HybF
MHELSLADSILELVGPKVHVAGRLKEVHVTVGPLSGVCVESLTFGFDALAQERGFERATLVVTRTPSRVRCNACGNEYACADLMQGCPSCGGLQRTVLSGDEFTVDSIEVDE